MRFFLIAALVSICIIECSAKLQNVTVKGVAVCNKKRLANVQIELYEKDTLDPDDLLSTVHTNSEGEFTVYGEEDETHAIAPYIRITHNCNPSKPNCNRIGEYVVPKDKIGGTYEMTYVTLDIKCELQNVTVKGVVICKKQRMENAIIEIWEKETISRDDLLSTVLSNIEGEFQLFGEDDEVFTAKKADLRKKFNRFLIKIGSIDPILRITHKCNLRKPNCKRVGEYIIPEDKIGSVYDMTYISLDIYVHNEVEKCS